MEKLKKQILRWALKLNGKELKIITADTFLSNVELAMSKDSKEIELMKKRELVYKINEHLACSDYIGIAEIHSPEIKGIRYVARLEVIKNI